MTITKESFIVQHIQPFITCEAETMHEILEALKIKKGLEKAREAIQKEVKYVEGKQSHVHQDMFLKIIDEIIEDSKK